MLTTTDFYTALKANSTAGEYPFNGAAFDSLSWAIAGSLNDWFPNPLNVTVAGNAVGTVGAGIILAPTSKLFLVPNVPLMLGGLTGAGLKGPLASSLAIVTTLAIAQAVTAFGGYQGACGTVGVGVDVSKVVFTNIPSLISLLLSNMAGHQITGAASVQMATGLANGISALALTTTGTGSVTGTPSLVPSTSPSFSKVV